jgi:hypothetical protein
VLPHVVALHVFPSAVLHQVCGDPTCAAPATEDKKEPMAQCPLACLGFSRGFGANDAIAPMRSIFLWQQEDRCRAIRFGQHPNPITGAGGIRGQNAKPLLD